MALELNKLESLVRAAFPEAEIVINDLAGDNNHYALEIKSAVFEGKSRVLQHKMVHDSLKGYLGDILHALSIKTSI